MFSYINDAVIAPREPLHPGHYYFLDCSEAIATYLDAPSAVRMEAVSDAEEMSEYEIADIELNAVFSALDLRIFDDRLEYYTESILNDGIDQIKDTLKAMGMFEEDLQYNNTQLQLRHADIIEQLGNDVAKMLRQYGFYDTDGILKVEYVGLLRGGLVALREAEYIRV